MQASQQQINQPTPNQVQGRWQFWIDRGGTFTDIVACRPDGTLVTHKLLSENPEHYADAAVAGIRCLLGVAEGAPIPVEKIATVKMGTTVATNALLERKGEPTLLCITQGFADALQIGYQHRPHLFDQHIILPSPLYSEVIEAPERVDAQGQVLLPLQVDTLRLALQAAYDQGLRALAIVLMHAWRYPAHELQILAMAKAIGYTQISASHQASPLMKLVARGDTTVVDAYLSPVLRRYVEQVARALPGVDLQFMQSHGGLTAANNFQGKDSILSGPAGGIVGMARCSLQAGFDKVIGFDMGGTSTDVSHFKAPSTNVTALDLEQTFDAQIAGVRLRVPMLAIHTVAAGGGSIVHFDGSRFQVGPDSAGANPGPACYRRGGPLTMTDCNVMLGKIQPDYFPKVFGHHANEALDRDTVVAQFEQLARRANDTHGGMLSAAEVAEGLVDIAVASMANAIKQISVARGHDVTEYTLTTFGGAGGQHACRVADALGMQTILAHPLAGVLSAYGMGLAEQTVMREQTMACLLTESNLAAIIKTWQNLETASRQLLQAQGVALDTIILQRRAQLRYEGTDATLTVMAGTVSEMQAAFEQRYRQRYALLMSEKPIMVESLQVQAHVASPYLAAGAVPSGVNISTAQPEQAVAGKVRFYSGGRWHDASLYLRQHLLAGQVLRGPAIMAEANTTLVIEPGWQAEVTSGQQVVLRRQIDMSHEATPRQKKARWALGKTHHPVDPILLEVFNNLFMSIAEQMGARLQNTASSVNIKERLDFSCAIFDAAGNLIANAPHMPVHLGSMGESIKTVMRKNHGTLQPGDVIALNDPYAGGTHLPDVTVVTPVFDEQATTILFYVASRGHHADIGGITPGSMPPHSTTVEEEGVLLDNVKLVSQGQFCETALRTHLSQARYPARNIEQNLADLRAQIAANQKGCHELLSMVDHYGLDVVQAYMQHVQDNAEQAVRRAISRLDLQEGQFTYWLDNGAIIAVRVKVNQQAGSAVIDFTGTSAQLSNNFNAPKAVCMAAVLYVFRTLVEEAIPLNAGCLRPLQVIVPEGSMLSPHYPAAVVSGNVETSSCIVNALYGALGILASSQGTMNNFTFGNSTYQYYETIAGGSGAGPSFNGTDVVQTHMTNSRLTDPEVLEWRYPVLLESYAIRHGSGGAGRWVGGNGGVRRLRFLETMTASILSNNRLHAPFGMAGGQAGAVGKNYVIRADGKQEALNFVASTTMEVGDVFVIETPGGGGYGPPLV